MRKFWPVIIILIVGAVVGGFVVKLIGDITARPTAPAADLITISPNLKGKAAEYVSNYRKLKIVNAELRQAIKETGGKPTVVTRYVAVAEPVTELAPAEVKTDRVTFAWKARGGGDGAAYLDGRDARLNFYAWRIQVESATVREGDVLRVWLYTAEPGITFDEITVQAERPGAKWYAGLGGGYAGGEAGGPYISGRLGRGHYSAEAILARGYYGGGIAYTWGR